MSDGRTTPTRMVPYSGLKTKPEGPARPLTAEQVTAIGVLLSVGENELLKPDFRTKLKARDWALFWVMISTMLRVSDIVRLRIGDVKDQDGMIRDEFTLRQKKTGKMVKCILSQKAKEALRAYFDVSENMGLGASLFGINVRRIQVLTKKWVNLINLDDTHLSPHSLRRTMPTKVYRETRNIRAAQVMLGHSSIVQTAQYLGIEEMEAIEIFRDHAI